MGNDPFSPGDRVRIRKGTMIRPFGEPWKPAGRTYTVTVDHLLGGYDAHENWRGEPVPASPGVVRWAGSGGYWCEAAITDVELVVTPPPPAPVPPEVGGEGDR